MMAIEQAYIGHLNPDGSLKPVRRNKVDLRTGTYQQPEEKGRDNLRYLNTSDPSGKPFTFCCGTPGDYERALQRVRFYIDLLRQLKN